jgi:hypothetical protein
LAGKVIRGEDGKTSFLRAACARRGKEQGDSEGGKREQSHGGTILSAGSRSRRQLSLEPAVNNNLNQGRTNDLNSYILLLLKKQKVDRIKDELIFCKFT